MTGPHALLARVATAAHDRLKRQIDYIEVGVCAGHSALAVLQTGFVHLATLIDNWQNSSAGDVRGSEQIARKTLKPYMNVVEIFSGDSKQVLPRIFKQYDIGFVDGDHSDAGCLADMTNMLPLIRVGGSMFVDDLQNHAHRGLQKLCENFAIDNLLDFTFHEDHNGVGELKHYET